jgi:hypothetical protein
VRVGRIVQNWIDRRCPPLPRTHVNLTSRVGIGKAPEWTQLAAVHFTFLYYSPAALSPTCLSFNACRQIFWHHEPPILPNGMTAISRPSGLPAPPREDLQTWRTVTGRQSYKVPDRARLVASLVVLTLPPRSSPDSTITILRSPWLLEELVQIRSSAEALQLRKHLIFLSLHGTNIQD